MKQVSILRAAVVNCKLVVTEAAVTSERKFLTSRGHFDITCPTSNLGGWYFVSDNFEGYLIEFKLYLKNIAPLICSVGDEEHPAITCSHSRQKHSILYLPITCSHLLFLSPYLCVLPPSFSLPSLLSSTASFCSLLTLVLCVFQSGSLRTGQGCQKEAPGGELGCILGLK